MNVNDDNSFRLTLSYLSYMLRYKSSRTLCISTDKDILYLLIVSLAEVLIMIMTQNDCILSKIKST